MYLNDIEATCFIMALFIRDDGLRFLLGTGAYEFKESQLHFSGNTIENDVVSIQGNDGYMLAGQVRRPSTQVFDGYIGDATIAKSEIEGFRRDFFAFFRKNHFYTVVYVLPDGSAIQRRRGFLVDAPTVKELRQMYPEYHVGLNFEDVNYYKYAEDDAGQEIYGKSANIGLAKEQFGGLIWDDRTQTQINKSGSDFAAIGTIDNEPIDSIELQGDTQQKTISGAQLLTKQGMATPPTDTNFWQTISTTLTMTPKDNGWCNIEQSSSGYGNFQASKSAIYNFAVSTTYTLIFEIANVSGASSGYIQFLQPAQIQDPFASFTIITGATGGDSSNVRTNLNNPDAVSVVKVTTKSSFASNTRGLRLYTGSNTNLGAKFDIRATVLLGDHSSDWQNYMGNKWQPFVGGVASPNPDYPQEVQTVTGRQVVTISDGGSESQEYEINLGKNLFDKDNPSYMGGYFEIGGTISTSSSNRNRIIYIPCEANTTYSLTKATGTWAGGSWTLGVCHEIPAAGVQVYNTVGIGKSTTYSGYTTDSNSIYLVLRCQNADSTTYAWDNQVGDTGLTVWQTVLAGLQIEKNIVATEYASYFAPIELCKIGDYQDYIYMSGEDWYIHKAIAIQKYTGASAESWQKFEYSGVSMWRSTVIPSGMDTTAITTDTFRANNAKYWVNDGTSVSTGLSDGEFGFNSAASNFNIKWNVITTLSDWETWLTSNPMIVYYPLATPTDTQITDADLIAQLETLDSATTCDDITWFKSSSDDLPVIMNVDLQAWVGGGVSWDANGAEWEDGGGGQIVNVTIDSIDSVYPVWIVEGEAINPALTNLTTGMSIAYNGTVASGQTLVIDLLNKTAKLSGTSVIQDVSGQWVEFTPGVNRVSYSTSNPDAPDSSIEWQEVVG